MVTWGSLDFTNPTRGEASLAVVLWISGVEGPLNKASLSWYLLCASMLVFSGFFSL